MNVIFLNRIKQKNFISNTIFLFAVSFFHKETFLIIDIHDTL